MEAYKVGRIFMVFVSADPIEDLDKMMKDIVNDNKKGAIKLSIDDMLYCIDYNKEKINLNLNKTKTILGERKGHFIANLFFDISDYKSLNMTYEEFCQVISNNIVKLVDTSLGFDVPFFKLLDNGELKYDSNVEGDSKFTFNPHTKIESCAKAKLYKFEIELIDKDGKIYMLVLK